MHKAPSLRSTFLFALAFFTIVGCGKSVPKDMPKTVPFKIKVVDGSKGIADVQVVMDGQSGSGSLAGKTDSSGVAVMSTTYKNYTAKGVPTGDYKVRCIKNPTVDHWKSEDERNKMTPGEMDQYYGEWQKKCDELPREVPKILEDFDKCPVTMTVSEAGEFVVDVSQYSNN